MDPLENEKIKQTAIRDKITFLNFESLSNSGRSAKIHLNTLASFTDYRAGSYAMSGLKKMTGTDTFLELPATTKKCKTETYEECHIVRYAAQVQNQCGCLPWGLSPSTAQQVNMLVGIWLILLHFEDASICPPPSTPCYLAISTADTYGCNVSCTGLYADVGFIEDQVLSDSVPKEVAEMLARDKLFLVKSS